LPGSGHLTPEYANPTRYVKAGLDVPPAVTTVTGPLLEDSGTVQTIRVSDHEETVPSVLLEAS